MDDDEVKVVEGLPMDFHPLAVSQHKGGKATQAAALGLEAIHTSMAAVLTAEKQIKDHEKLLPVASEVVANAMRHAGAQLKAVDAHISQLEKKLADALVPTPAEIRHADAIKAFLAKQGSPITLAMTMAQKGDPSLARMILDMPTYAVGTKGIDADQQKILREVVLQAALPAEFAEWEDAMKSRNSLQRGIDFTVNTYAKKAAACL